LLDPTVAAVRVAVLEMLKGGERRDRVRVVVAVSVEGQVRRRDGNPSDADRHRAVGGLAASVLVPVMEIGHVRM
jgi:hypothetical protein